MFIMYFICYTKLTYLYNRYIQSVEIKKDSFYLNSDIKAIFLKFLLQEAYCIPVIPYADFFTCCVPSLYVTV